MMINDLENQEALEYAQGTPVKLKNKPDRLYIVAEYDPIWCLRPDDGATDLISQRSGAPLSP